MASDGERWVRPPATTAANLEYLREHNVDSIVDHIVGALGNEKPEHPRAWLASYLANNDCVRPFVKDGDEDQDKDGMISYLHEHNISDMVEEALEALVEEKPAAVQPCLAAFFARSLPPAVLLRWQGADLRVAAQPLADVGICAEAVVEVGEPPDPTVAPAPPGSLTVFLSFPRGCTVPADVDHKATVGGLAALAHAMAVAQ